MNNKDNYAITLARVSSKEQEDEGYSVDAQTLFLEKYCESKGLKVVKAFKIAETASKPDMRKEFQRMLEYLQKHDIKHSIIDRKSVV